MYKHDILLDVIKKQKPHNIVEIGTQFYPYDSDQGKLWGSMTYHFAKWANGNGAKFYTIDIDPEHIYYAMQNIHYPISGLVGDGAKILAELKIWIDFLYLDSADEPEISLEQFKTAEPYLTDKAIVTMDDIFDWGPQYDKKLGKGTLVIPYAQEKGWKFERVPAFDDKDYLCDIAILTK
jgi:predicted O-methyltransferase YrrM